MQYRKLTRYLYSLVFSLIIGLSGSVQAACLQSDMAGRWITYISITHIEGGDEEAGAGADHYTVRCKIIMNSLSQFSRFSSTCKPSDRSPTYISGRMILKPSCNISLTRFYHYDASGNYVGYSVMQHASISREKTVLSGVGLGNPWEFILTGTKR